jgi:hypothetical protein
MSEPTLFPLPPADPRPEKPCTPAPLGTGPAGETCRGCRHAAGLPHGSKTIYKCDLMQACWTHGGATDIKLRWEACRCWEAKES